MHSPVSILHPLTIFKWFLYTLIYIYSGAQKKVATVTKWRPRDILRIEIAGKTEKWADAELF